MPSPVFLNLVMCCHANWYGCAVTSTLELFAQPAAQQAVPNAAAIKHSITETDGYAADRLGSAVMTPAELTSRPGTGSVCCVLKQ